MISEQYWQNKSKCKALTPEQADALFFPPSGGKPQKADRFCSNCPVRGICLVDAIENKLTGFLAGTTEDDRRIMRNNWHGEALKVTGLPMPPEPTGRRILRKLVVAPDVHEWLDSDIEPSPEDLAS